MLRRAAAFLGGRLRHPPRATGLTRRRRRTPTRARAAPHELRQHGANYRVVQNKPTGARISFYTRAPDNEHRHATRTTASQTPTPGPELPTAGASLMATGARGVLTPPRLTHRPARAVHTPARALSSSPHTAQWRTAAPARRQSGTPHGAARAPGLKPAPRSDATRVTLTPPPPRRPVAVSEARHDRGGALTMMAPAITLEALGLGRSPACCAFDGPSAPLPIRLELLAAAQAAVELHYSFPHPTPEFEAEARPILVKLIEAFDCRPDLSTILAVHAVLNRLVHADRLEAEASDVDASPGASFLHGLDERVARAMGASSHAYKKWRARLNKLRNQAPRHEPHLVTPAPDPAPPPTAPLADAPSDSDVLGAVGALIEFANANSGAPSSPPSPPLSSDGDGAAPSSESDGSTPESAHDADRGVGCLLRLCGGSPFGKTTLVFRCRRTVLPQHTAWQSAWQPTAADFTCLSCHTRFQSSELERLHQLEHGAPPSRTDFPPAPAPPATTPAAASCTLESRGLGRSPACCAFDGPPADGVEGSCCSS